ncbi:LuxR family transcriptional regulator [Dictyobacter alpinus]|uniref:LuxR family transcriptional regulator n=1 Tax=Dictyobacter alpinus TaxID=2014873 RepID=A0A402BJV0_9CHLR|nr:adenylate/guanylate cyclase domain-containing protein [Dictyobacter alpinus]GCE31631.1 LuxR family transcriptional regulator [Dictyobacter alpinus]
MNKTTRRFPGGVLTLLFTDIEGSTRLLQQLGSRYADMLRECRRVLRAAFTEQDGYEVDTQGDAFFVVFERAQNAILAAASAQQSLHNTTWPDGVSVRVRMGIHTGELQEVEEGYIGLDVHHAARIMSAAHGGQVLLSQRTHDLIAHELPEPLTIQDLGEYRLKDIPGHSRLFQLVQPHLPQTFPRPATLGRRRSLQGIPSNLASFVGREHELVMLTQRLSRPDVRLLTLIGTAGVGKTRLAFQVARQLEERSSRQICFVALERVRTTDEVLFALAQALDVQEDKNSSLLEQLKSALQEQALILILDNFEHVLPARLLIADLLASCPHLQILVTSRVILHLQAEHIFELAPLPLPAVEAIVDLQSWRPADAISLFVQRAQAVLPNFVLNQENVSSIIKICSYLDGIPLAIELAAAHTRHFKPAQLLARLEQGTIFLQGKAQDVPERQQTLHTAIDWSYNLLEADEQRVFRRMAVCTGGVTLEAAEQVCSASSPVQGNILEVLESLVDKSMLRLSDDWEGEPRYWLLRTLREYGLESLSSTGELQATQAALSEYIVSWITRITPLLNGAEQIFWLDQLDREYDNVRVALRWLLSVEARCTEHIEQAIQLCSALMRFWEIRCYFADGSAFLQQALAASQGISPIIKAQALHNAGFMALLQNEAARAESYLRESQLLFRESGDKESMANILRLQGNLAMVRDNYKVARRLLEEALTLYIDLDNPRRCASTREALVQIACIQGSYQRALTLADEALVAYQALGEHYSTAYPLFDMATILFLAGQERARAKELAEESLALFRSIGNKRLVALVLVLLGQIHYASGDEEVAMTVLEEARHLFKQINERHGTAETLVVLARISGLRGEGEQARALYEEAWKHLSELGGKELAALCLEGYGQILVTLKQAQHAVQCWGIAAGIRAQIVAPMPPVYKKAYLKAMDRARAKLKSDDFQEAWLAGSRLAAAGFEAATYKDLATLFTVTPVGAGAKDA